MKIDEKLHEECAVFGVSLMFDEAAGVTYNGLLSLQHRGQEGAGIAAVKDRNIVCRKNVGLVSEVFSHQSLGMFSGSKTAVGHTRYSTTGDSTIENVAPFVTEYLTGRIATAHNGNITNSRELRGQLEACGLHFNASSDSEVVSSLVAFHIMKQGDILSGVAEAAKLLRGAFSLVIASSENKLIAVRDPNGYRPLCIGKTECGMAVSSESCALDTCGFDFIRDVQPGEIIIIENGVIESQGVMLPKAENRNGLCIFEYIYFARTDSVIDGLSVYEARRNMGEILAEQCPAAADVVCGVPDSGLEAANGFSKRSGIPLVSGFVRNRYVGRSFIYPTQAERDNAVRLKLNPLGANISGKRIVLVDDSLVRGTTSEKIIRSLRKAGAREVHLRISSPPILHPCNYGTDIDKEENLIANQKSVDEICRRIGADSLGYISIKGLETACEKSMRPFCTACFTSGAAE